MHASRFMLSVIVLSTGACSDPPTQPAPSQDGAAITAARGGQPKVDVCHGLGNGSWNLLDVAAPAVQAHLNHGDGLPFGAVPNMPGFSFGGACEVIEDAVDPCVDFTWSLQAAPVPFAVIQDMWGSAADDVYAVGRDDLVNTPAESGIILNWDGGAWSVALDGDSPILGFRDVLFSVFGFSAEDIWAVGENGRIVHYDGVTWSSVSSGTSERLLGVWGAASDDIWAVGTSGTIRHYDGVAWTAVSSPTGGAIGGVWGASANDVYAVANTGDVLRYDGVQWSLEETLGAPLREVWGSSPNDVIAIGDGGAIFRSDGLAWSADASGVTSNLRGVWGLGSDDVYVVGITPPVVAHFDGSQWCSVEPGFSTGVLQGVWPTSTTEVLAGGNQPGGVPALVIGSP